MSNFVQRVILLAILCLSVGCLSAQDLKSFIAEEKLKLEKLVKKANRKGIETAKERMTLRTAEIFTKYADWDEMNTDKNIEVIKQTGFLRKKAEKFAKDLPNFERQEVLQMLKNASQELELVIKGKIFRQPQPQIDWSKLRLKDGQIMMESRPVFLADYTWKPQTKELQEYYGSLDKVFMTPAFVSNQNGNIKQNFIHQLKTKPSGNLGSVFIGHQTYPKWAKAKDPNFTLGARRFTAYDIDNPLAREIQTKLIGGTVPLMKGKQYTKLGYLLANEPHWYSMTDTWNTGEVSPFTILKFKQFLTEKHGNINHLNKVWETDYKNFQEIEIAIPIDKTLQGTPKWYDWVSFNMRRVNEWFVFLKAEVQKHDPEAKTHIKVMPNLWSENKRDHGIDMEFLTNLTEIIGNDASSYYTKAWKKGKEHWEDKYAYEWREMCMSYDFYKSVSPNKVIYNSEAHYLSTTKSRDLKMPPAYARATYWIATTQGLDVSQTWFWPRLADGSVSQKAGKGYAASLMMQPRILNEVTATMMDLNANADVIVKMQDQRKPIRIFYSETSAIQKNTHMDDVFELYESLSFEGSPIGFLTQNLLETQPQKHWNMMLVYETPFITKAEQKAIQSYLNKGGTILIDKKSLLKDEYGRPLKPLNAKKGKLVVLNTLEEMKTKAFSLLKESKLLPKVIVQESNAIGAKGCLWKCVEASNGKQVLSIVNIGKSEAKLDISLQGVSKTICKDLIKGIEVSNKPSLKPFEVYFVEVSKQKEL